MRRSIEIICVGVGVIILCLTVYFFIDAEKAEDRFQVLTFGAGLMFFAYKLLTGWLFINLSISMAPKREHAGNEQDHLALEISLAKGNIDSLWVSSIECKISGHQEKDDAIIPHDPKFIQAVGTKKREPPPGRVATMMDYWTGKENPFYVVSPNETAIFACYTTVPKASVVVVEIVVIGKRPFYGIEKRHGKSTQWRSSFIVLPVSQTTIKT